MDNTYTSELIDKEQKLREIEKKIKECKACPLYKACMNKVPGAGKANAKIFLIGEAPGRMEDRTGMPFVGPAGKFLDELLRICNIKRSEVFIGNMVKCRPPNNRDPEDMEIKKCSRFLEEQIYTIKPKIIITLGRFSSEYIANKYGIGQIRISRDHGKVFSINTLNGKIKIIPMYHPAAGLYRGEVKDYIIEDWKSVCKELRE